MIPEHALAILTEDIPRLGLAEGDIGSVVFVHRGGEAYQVEFVALDGSTLDVVLLRSNQVRPAVPREVAHARLVGSAEPA